MIPYFKWPLHGHFWLQRKRSPMPAKSCCCCGEKVQNRGLEARYSHGPFHNYCREWQIKVILFNDPWPPRSRSFRGCHFNCCSPWRNFFSSLNSKKKKNNNTNWAKYLHPRPDCWICNVDNGAACLRMSRTSGNPRRVGRTPMWTWTCEATKLYCPSSKCVQ